MFKVVKNMHRNLLILFVKHCKALLSIYNKWFSNGLNLKTRTSIKLLGHVQPDIEEILGYGVYTLDIGEIQKLALKLSQF